MKYIKTYIFDIPNLDYLNDELNWNCNDIKDVKNILDNWNIEELIDWEPPCKEMSLIKEN